jgi:hypothetical protein
MRGNKPAKIQHPLGNAVTILNISVVEWCLIIGEIDHRWLAAITRHRKARRCASRLENAPRRTEPANNRTDVMSVVPEARIS